MGDKMKIALLIRVYDRVEDLKYNLEIIKDTWSENDYYVVVISNGLSDGYSIDDALKPYIDKLVVLESNEGHMKGSSQLLREGIKHIPEGYNISVILEADTWLYGDHIISKYAAVLSGSDISWASANWYDKFYSLATDFAIVKSDYLRNNPELIQFRSFPECYISNYMHNRGDKHINIAENMPVHVPSYVFKYPYVHNDSRRFYAFPESKMVTHHIEWLKGGMLQKKKYFNIISQADYFEDIPVKNKKWELFKIKFWIKLSYLFPKRSWYSKRYYMKLDYMTEKK